MIIGELENAALASRVARICEPKALISSFLLMPKSQDIHCISSAVVTIQGHIARRTEINQQFTQHPLFGVRPARFGVNFKQ